MRIAWIAPNARAVTGPSTYAEAALGALANKAEVVRLSAYERLPEAEPFDGIHFQDVKRLSPEAMRWASQRSERVTIEFHDDYFLPPILRAPDRAARLLLARRRQTRYLALARAANEIVLHSRHMKRRIDAWTERESLLIPYPKPESLGPFVPQPQRPPTALFVGRDWYRKGAPTLVRAFRKVVQRIPSARLEMVGEEYAHSKAHVRFLCRGLPVTFLGGLSQPDTMERMRNASVLAIPSLQEAFGIVQLEAAACGAAICASDVDGLNEFVRDGANGRLAPAGDVEMWAQRLIELLENADLRARLAQRALEDLREWPDAERVAEALAEIYRGSGRNREER